MQYANLYLAQHDTAVLKQYNELMAHLQALPQDEKSYGMIRNNFV